MYLLLSDMADFLLNPFTWVLLLLLLALMFRRKRSFKVLWVAIAVLLVFSNEFLVDEALRAYEMPPQKINEANTLIVLGGNMAGHEDRTGEPIYRQGSYRILKAIELLQSHDVKTLVISGGSGDRHNPGVKEAVILGRLLDSLCLGIDELLIEDSSRTTYENARYTAMLLQGHSDLGAVVLLGSALHMRRASACFQKQGMKTIACPVNQYTGHRRWILLLRFHPVSFSKWQELLHEIAGMIYYKMSDKA